jgi:PAS domain S-box-containing protein
VAVMIKADEAMEKLLTIEKAVHEMVSLSQGIIDLKEAEAKRQKAMEEIEASGEKYRILLDHLPQKIFLKNTNSVYTFCNQSYAAYLKNKPEEIAGKTDYDFHPAEWAEKLVAEDRRILAAGSPENREEQFVREGQSVIFHTVKMPVKDKNGEALGILGVSWEVTDQKRKEDELKKICEHLEETLSGREAELQWANKLLQQGMAERRMAEERLKGAEGLRRIFEKMATPAVMIEENGVLSQANSEFEKLSGYSKKEVEGKKCLMDFFAQRDSERIVEYYGRQEATPGAVLRDAKCQLLVKNGDLRDVSLTLSMIPDSKRSVASLMDITEAKRTEERVEEMEEIYDSIIQNIHESIALVQDGVLKFANPKLFEILGYTTEELSSQPFREFVFPEDRERFENDPGNLSERGLSRPCSFRLVDKDGRVHWVENKEALIKWEKKKAVLHFLTDNTARKQAQEELCTSIDSFRRLVDALEKYLFPSDGNGAQHERLELS